MAMIHHGNAVYVEFVEVPFLLDHFLDCCQCCLCTTGAQADPVRLINTYHVGRGRGREGEGGEDSGRGKELRKCA